MHLRVGGRWRGSTGAPRTSTKRMQPGEIAVIDHADLDRVAAEGLIERGRRRGAQRGASITGRYPNGGPIRLVERRHPARRRPRRRGDGRVAEATGRHASSDGVGSAGRRDARRRHGARRRRRRAADGGGPRNMGEELERFAENTLEYIQQRRRSPSSRSVLPAAAAEVPGPPRDGRGARARLPDRPHGVEAVPPRVRAGADRRRRRRRRAARPRLHARHHHRRLRLAERRRGALRRRAARTTCTRRPRARRENLEASSAGPSTASSSPRARARTSRCCSPTRPGASLIVAVGTHSTMVEILDKGRRHVVDVPRPPSPRPVLVDAKGVNRLYEGASAAATSSCSWRRRADHDHRRRSIVAEPIDVFLRGLWG